jgi:hypothetical protein
MTDWTWLQNDAQRRLVTAAALLVDALDKSGVFDARLELPQNIAPAVATLRSALADIGVVSVIEQGNVPAELARLGAVEPDNYQPPRKIGTDVLDVPHVVSMDPPTPENDPVGRFRSPAAEFLAQQRREGATHEPPKRWTCEHCQSVNILSNWKCYFCGRLPTG